MGIGSEIAFPVSEIEEPTESGYLIYIRWENQIPIERNHKPHIQIQKLWYVSIRFCRATFSTLETQHNYTDNNSDAHLEQNLNWKKKKKNQHENGEKWKT